MRNSIILSVDVMGGDGGCDVSLPGAEAFLERCTNAKLILVGDQSCIEEGLQSHPRVSQASEIIHTDVHVTMDEKPSSALRKRRTSGMWRALDQVALGKAHACVSAGNTAALMMMSKFCIKSLPGIDRSALAAIWPTLRGESIVLDVGATIGHTEHTLVNLSIMGSAMAKALFGVKRPSIGLLNIGVEEFKGLEAIRSAGKFLREQDLPFLHYHGFIEGNDLGKGTVDVAVCDAFSGNVALKAAEGTAQQISEMLRLSISRSLMSKIGYF